MDGRFEQILLAAAAELGIVIDRDRLALFETYRETLLLWNSAGATEERIVRDAQRPTEWVVDGQQRATALCILFGRKPYWWPSAEEWEKALHRYDIRFDVHAKASPFFVVADAVIRRARGDRYVPLSRLLVLDTSKEKDQKALQELAREIKAQGLCDGMDAMEVYARLDRVRKIRDKDIVAITVDHELEDVVEIFSRLNSRGTRVTEADIYLGVVAARSPGWVRDTFLPYLHVLGGAGFKLNPNLLFRCMTGIGSKKVRFKLIDDDFWERARPHFSDELMTDLTISCAMWVGMGRMLSTLDIGQSCMITLPSRA